MKKIGTERNGKESQNPQRVPGHITSRTNDPNPGPRSAVAWHAAAAQARESRERRSGAGASLPVGANPTNHERPARPGGAPRTPRNHHCRQSGPRRTDVRDAGPGVPRVRRSPCPFRPPLFPAASATAGEGRARVSTPRNPSSPTPTSGLPSGGPTGVPSSRARSRRPSRVIGEARGVRYPARRPGEERGSPLPRPACRPRCRSPPSPRRTRTAGGAGSCRRGDASEKNAKGGTAPRWKRTQAPRFDTRRRPRGRRESKRYALRSGGNRPFSPPGWSQPQPHRSREDALAPCKVICPRRAWPFAPSSPADADQSRTPAEGPKRPLPRWATRVPQPDSPDGILLVRLCPRRWVGVGRRPRS